MDDKAIALILGALLAMSEALALIPALKSSSLLQLATNIFKKGLSLFSKKEEPKKDDPT